MPFISTVSLAIFFNLSIFSSFDELSLKTSEALSTVNWTNFSASDEKDFSIKIKDILIPDYERVIHATNYVSSWNHRWVRF